MVLSVVVLGGLVPAAYAMDDNLGDLDGFCEEEKEIRAMESSIGGVPGGRARERSGAGVRREELPEREEVAHAATMAGVENSFVGVSIKQGLGVLEAALAAMRDRLVLTAEQREGRRAASAALSAGVDADDVEVVQQALEAGANPNKQNASGVSPMMKAVFGDNEEVVKLMLQHKADINVLCSTKDTLLSLSIIGGHEKVVSALLDAKADPHAKTGVLQISPLANAVVKRGVPVVKALLTYGARVNEVINSGPKDTTFPLLVAAELLDSEMIKTLVEARANIEIDNDNGETPLFIACKFGCEDSGACAQTVRILLDAKALPNAATKTGMSPLMRVVCNGANDVMAMLLEEGASVNALNKYKKTALSYAVAMKNKHAIKGLLYSGARLDAVGFGMTIFDAVCEDDDKEIKEIVFKWVLDGGPVNAIEHGNCREDEEKNDNDLMAAMRNVILVEAARAGDADLFARALKAGVNVNAFVPGKGFALVQAASQGHGGIVSQLLAARAHPNIDDGRGANALYAAALGKSREHLDVAKKLLVAGADIKDGTFLRAVINGNMLMVKLLLEYKANTEAVDAKGSTALALAIAGGQEEMVCILLMHKANPQSENINGVDCLSRAYDQTNVNIQQMIFNAIYAPEVLAALLSAQTAVENNEDEEKGAAAVCCVIYPRCAHAKEVNTQEDDIKICGACTFVNSVKAKDCEICSTKL